VRRQAKRDAAFSFTQKQPWLFVGRPQVFQRAWNNEPTQSSPSPPMAGPAWSKHGAGERTIAIWSLELLWILELGIWIFYPLLMESFEVRETRISQNSKLSPSSPQQSLMIRHQHHFSQVER
jgi:hypothetical protein